MAIREKEKLRNLGMVFKPSLKCLKTRMFVLSEYIYIISSYIIFVEPFWLNKKSGLAVKKNAI